MTPLTAFVIGAWLGTVVVVACMLTATSQNSRLNSAAWATWIAWLAVLVILSGLGVWMWITSG